MIEQVRLDEQRSGERDTPPGRDMPATPIDSSVPPASTAAIAAAMRGGVTITVREVISGVVLGAPRDDGIPRAPRPSTISSAPG